MADQVAAPKFPAELESNTRRAARAIKSTVQFAIDTMSEVAVIINRYRAGESQIISRLQESKTEEAAAWKRAVEEAAKRDAAADSAYAEAIKPLQEARDKAKNETAETVKQYFQDAVKAEQFGEDETPVSREEYSEAIADWTASAQQIRNAEGQAKRQLSLEFKVEIPNIGAGARDGGGSGQWRPRFSAASVKGKDLGESPILTDVVAEIPGLSRELFIGHMLKHLPNGRASWDAMTPGETLSFTVGPVNGESYPVQLTKAEPITRGKKADGTDDTDSDEESDDSES